MATNVFLSNDGIHGNFSFVEHNNFPLYEMVYGNKDLALYESAQNWKMGGIKNVPVRFQLRWFKTKKQSRQGMHSRTVSVPYYCKTEN